MSLFRAGMPALVIVVAGAAQAATPVSASLDVIEVTERRLTDLSTAPASVSALDSDEILRVNADHPAEALNRVPGVLIHRGNGQEHLTAIRSPVLTGGAGAGSFLFLEDGVPLRAAGFANVNGLFESHSEIAERIEVVRGPSGALYGANAVHGVINVVTRAPGEGAGFLAETTADTIGRVKGRGFVSYGGGGHGFLAAISALNDPGFRAESGADDQKLSLRHDFKGNAVSVRTIGAFVNLNQETAGFVEGPEAYRDATLRRSNPNPNSFRDAKSARLSSRVDLDLGEGATLSLTPFARWNDMSFRLHFFPSQALEENSHWSIGAQNAFYLDRDGWSLIAGVDVEYSDGDLSEIQTRSTIGTFTQGVHYDYRVTSTTASPFASVAGEILPGLTASAAARLDWTRYDYDNRTESGVVGRFLRPDDRRDSFTTVSPKFSLSYDVGRSLVYASFARGARPPQTTDLYRLQINQTTDPAKPETIDAFELGLKGAAFGLFRYDLAGYFMAKENFFFRDADGFNVNDGRTRHVGGEASVAAGLPFGFSVDANASYGRHTYRFDRPVLSLPQASEAIHFGDDVDTAPRWIAGARLAWTPDWAPVEAEAEWVRLGDYFADAANSVRYPGHDLLHLRADWRVTKGLTAGVAIRNLFNEFYAERADFAFGTERYFPGEGRVAAFSLRIES